MASFRIVLHEILNILWEKLEDSLQHTFQLLFIVVAAITPDASSSWTWVSCTCYFHLCDEAKSRPTYSDVADVTSDVFISLGEIISFRSSTKHRACDFASMNDEQN